ncbi:MAG TPA: hypothetical protein VHM70_04670 [Polyangiaceae bacterium]|nr:hypothetical protein [Polyangiaceae bacterium]
MAVFGLVEPARAQPAGPAPKADEANTGSLTAGPGQVRIWPAKTVFLPIEATNMPEADADAFGALFTHAYEAASGGRVMPPAETTKVLEPFSSPEELVKAAGAQGYLRASLVRLDSRTVIEVALFDAAGKRLRSEKLTASGLDDFEPAADRLAKSLSGARSPAETRTLDTVTEREAIGPARIASERRAGLRGGAVLPISNSSIAPLVMAALDVRFESEQRAFGFGIALLIPSASDGGQRSYGGLSSEVNGLYYLTSSAVAPYVGGGLYMRIIGSDANTVANVAPYALVGLAMSRDSRASAYLELRAAQNVTPLRLAAKSTITDTTTGASVTNTSSGRVEYPFEPSLNFGIAF